MRRISVAEAAQPAAPEAAVVEVPADQKAPQPWRIAFIPQLIGIPYFTAMKPGGNDATAAFGVE